VERVKNINVSYVKLIVKKGDELVYKYFTERLAKYLYFNIAILYKNKMSCGCSGNSNVGQTGGCGGNGGTGGGPIVSQLQKGGGEQWYGPNGGSRGPHFAPHGQTGGGTRRRKHTRRGRRSGTRKTRVYGRKRACKCPGGCKRSTCPCRTGKRSCCTKRCRCLGARV